MNDQKLSLFLMLGQSATKELARTPRIVREESLTISESYDLAALLPDSVTRSREAAEVFRLFFVFEVYLRELIIKVLSKDGVQDWWAMLPPDVVAEVKGLEEAEETKAWMALGSRDKSSLLTYPQLLRAIEHCWKDYFSELLHDRALVQQARVIGHLRNAICHMTTIPEEEIGRVKQTMRDWFRKVPP